MEPIDVTNRVREIGLGALGTRMGQEVTSAVIDANGWATVEGMMPVEGNTQPYGLLHGGANAVLAESLGSIASAMTAQATLGDGHIVVGVDLNCTHHRSAKEGSVAGTARIISAGRTVITSTIEIRDDQNRLICTSRLTCLVRKVTD